jgi:hypothetical protein
MNAPSITRMLLIAGLGLSQPALSAQGQPQAPAAPTTPKAPAIRVPDALVNPITPDETSEPAPTPETPAQPFDPAAYRAAVKRANAAVAQQDWPDAAKSLEEVLALKPDSKEAAYNLGVARFQQGDFAGARKMFQQSAQNAPADLAARSMYNEGNSIYADAVRNLPPIDPASKQGQPQQASTVPPEELQKAVQQVEQAFTHFKDAAAANPGDEDSAANAETSLKLLKELRKIQQQQQQQQQNKQQQDQQQDSKDQQQQQDQQQQNKQQNQDSKQDDSKQQPESQQSQSDSKSQQGDQQQQQQKQQQKQDQQQADSKNDQKPESKQDDSQQKDKRPETKPDPKQESDSKDQQKQDQQKQDQQQDQQQQNKQQPQQQQNKQPEQQSQQQAQASNDPNAKQGDAQAAEASEDRMDQTQADRLLQLVRDKEKSRNAQRKAEQARTRPTPVDRDW